jgi:epoxyqueuosine reductase QueG
MKDCMQNLLDREIRGFVKERMQAEAVRSAWEAPLVGFAAAEDPLFLRLKQAVRPSHALPADLLPGARTAVVYFLPFAAAVPRSNRRGRNASREWAAAYVETNRLIRDLNLHLAAVLEGAGFRSACPPPTHNFDTETLMSDWSHKHVAYVAGLGRFGVHHLLITARGCAGRFGSLVTDAVIPATSRPGGESCLNKHNGTCLACVRRCPSGALASGALASGALASGALSTKTLDRHRCYALCLENADLFKDEGLADVCGKCSAGVPCARVDPVARLGQRVCGKAG